MKIETIRCDHCGKELDGMKDYEDIKIELGHKWTACDLCTECLDELYEVVNSFITPKGE